MSKLKKRKHDLSGTMNDILHFDLLGDQTFDLYLVFTRLVLFGVFVLIKTYTFNFFVLHREGLECCLVGAYVGIIVANTNFHLDNLTLGACDSRLGDAVTI